MGKTLDESLSEAYDAIEARVDEKQEAKEPVAPEPETKETKETKVEPNAAEPENADISSAAAPQPVANAFAIEAPLAYSKSVREKWKDLPPDVQAELAKREDDIHKAMTRHDGDLQLGREIKEVVTPYMPLLRSYGVAPKDAIGDMMNTYHILYQGTPAQKASLIRETIRQHGIDIGQITAEQTAVNPELEALRQEIYQLRQQANPEIIKKTLQEEMEQSSIQSEVNAFASDPANLHYETVKPLMASLLGTGAASSMKEAYEMACKAHPAVSSTIEAQRQAAAETKKKAELEAKKKASTSIAGSSGVSVPNTRAKKSIDEALNSAWDSLAGNLIT